MYLYCRVWDEVCVSHIVTFPKLLNFDIISSTRKKFKFSWYIVKVRILLPTFTLAHIIWTLSSLGAPEKGWYNIECVRTGKSDLRDHTGIGWLLMSLTVQHHALCLCQDDGCGGEQGATGYAWIYICWERGHPEGHQKKVFTRFHAYQKVTWAFEKIWSWDDFCILNLSASCSLLRMPGWWISKKTRSH